jgi:hypothetical protein
MRAARIEVRGSSSNEEPLTSCSNLELRTSSSGTDVISRNHPRKVIDTLGTYTMTFHGMSSSSIMTFYGDDRDFLSLGLNLTKTSREVCSTSTVMSVELPRMVVRFDRGIKHTSTGVHMNTRGLSSNIMIVIR